jgi:hypothetical protein
MQKLIDLSSHYVYTNLQYFARYQIFDGVPDTIKCGFKLIVYRIGYLDSRFTHSYRNRYLPFPNIH